MTKQTLTVKMIAEFTDEEPGSNMRPGECQLCPTHGLGYCYSVDHCLRADMNAPTEMDCAQLHHFRLYRQIGEKIIEASNGQFFGYKIMKYGTGDMPMKVFLETSIINPIDRPVSWGTAYDMLYEG